MRHVSKIWPVVMAVGIVGTAWGLTGSGTEADPWRITSLADFDEFAGDPNYWDDYTRLETDVNLAGRVYDRAVIAPDVNDDEWGLPGTTFTGVFDGNGHTIVNLHIDDGGAGNDYLGLFGVVGYWGFSQGCEIRSVSLKGGSVSGRNFVGHLVGWKMEGTISNCHSIADVSGYESVGGLIGGNSGTIIECYCAGTVLGFSSVGGVTGGAAAIYRNVILLGVSLEMVRSVVLREITAV